MKPKHILGLLFVLTLLMGMAEARAVVSDPNASAMNLAVTLLFSFLCFYWYRLDSDIHQYRRGALLNVGIVMLAIVAVPYYLVRSRPRGQKAWALLRLAGFIVLLMVAAVLGAALYAVFA
jgi:hypothetical protein